MKYKAGDIITVYTEDPDKGVEAFDHVIIGTTQAYHAITADEYNVRPFGTEPFGEDYRQDAKALEEKSCLKSDPTYVHHLTKMKVFLAYIIKLEDRRRYLESQLSIVTVRYETVREAYIKYLTEGLRMCTECVGERFSKARCGERCGVAFTEITEIGGTVFTETGEALNEDDHKDEGDFTDEGGK